MYDKHPMKTYALYTGELAWADKCVVVVALVG